MNQVTESRIVITHATELKPGAKYLIAFDSSSVSFEGAQRLTHALKAIGVENAVAVLTDGNPTEVMRVVEQEA